MGWRKASIAAALAFMLASVAMTPRARAEEPETPPLDDAVPSDTPAEAPPPIPTPATPGSTPAPFSPSDLGSNETGKRIGVGVDVMFVLPFGQLAEATAPIAGSMFRFGYRVRPRFEIALRVGYLFGIRKKVDGAESKVDILPLWLGARLFLWRPFTGPYAALDAGMNSLIPGVDPAPTTASAERLTDLRRRFGGNLGVGWLLSQNLPIDFRAQLMFLNLIGRELNESLNISVSLGVGYTLQF